MFETIEFQGSPLYVFRDDTGVGWVAMKPICDAIGVTYPPQHTKVKTDPKFSCNDIVMAGSDGKRYQMTCIPVSQLTGWLYGINVNRVKKQDVRDRLLISQQQAHEVLYHHFMPAGGTAEELLQLMSTITSLQHELVEMTKYTRRLEQRIENMEKNYSSMWGKGLRSARTAKEFNQN